MAVHKKGMLRHLSWSSTLYSQVPPITTHHTFDMVMVRKKVSPAELLQRAKANGYKQESHREEDSKWCNVNTKALKDQNFALAQYDE
jgi:hypothetical protein